MINTKDIRVGQKFSGIYGRTIEITKVCAFLGVTCVEITGLYRYPRIMPINDFMKAGLTAIKNF